MLGPSSLPIPRGAEHQGRQVCSHLPDISTKYKLLTKDEEKNLTEEKIHECI